MADASKEKKKKKSETKKSDAKKTDTNSVEPPKEKAGSRKASATPETGLKVEVEVEESKPKAKPKPILKVSNVEVEIDESTTPLTPVATVEVNDDESSATVRLKPGKPVITAEVDIEETPPPPPKQILKPVATVEVDADDDSTSLTLRPGTAVPKPVISVDEPEPPSTIGRKSSYIAPKAATKRDVELLYEIDKDKIQELREAFHLFDLNNDGFIDKEDLKNTYVTLGKLDVCDDEIQHMLSEAINPLDFDAFVILLGYKSIELDPEEILLEALAQWDYDDSGLICEQRIKHDLTMWGDKFTAEEVEMALEDAPVFIHQDTGENLIDYVKFCKILCGLRKKPKMPQPGDYAPKK